MNDIDQDLRDLRRALAVPTERDLPAGRMLQREEHLMRSLRELAGRRADQPVAATRPARSWKRPALIAAALAVLVAVAYAGLGTLRSTPAYAVTSNPDGTVTFRIYQLADPAKATRDLRRAGLNATVLTAVAPGHCSDARPQDHVVPGLWYPGPAYAEIVVNPRLLPAHEGLLVVIVMIYEEGAYRLGQMLSTVVDLPMPTCYAASAPERYQPATSESPAPPQPVRSETPASPTN